jgi:hypothetical protein
VVALPEIREADHEVAILTAEQGVLYDVLRDAERRGEPQVLWRLASSLFIQPAENAAAAIGSADDAFGHLPHVRHRRAPQPDGGEGGHLTVMNHRIADKPGVRTYSRRVAIVTFQWRDRS